MRICGVDEVGRGPLAGPVVAAAVVLPDSFSKRDELCDSKKISKKKRDYLAAFIHDEAQVHIARVEPLEIDQINILQASLLAMQKAILGLDGGFDEVLVDGIHLPNIPHKAQAIIKGDSLHKEIAAASIVAKVYRDQVMDAYGALYPEYGFDKHSGYPTKVHLEALKRFGASPIHRKSFKPVAAL